MGVESNTWADDITNGKLEVFDPLKELPVSDAEKGWLILDQIFHLHNGDTVPD